ncbi:MAG TPA: fibronectin type III domain-containing protein [Longimicrobiaceae bacterium]|nr:fibronectin type III domain-containing protein [Longimicrobiaceae bacterium]
MRTTTRRTTTAALVAFGLLLAACSDSTGPSGPTAPANVASPAASANSVTLTWNAVSGATAYVVQRSVAGAAYEEVARPTAATYVDTGLQPSTSYSYQVAAIKADGTPTPFSTPVAVSTKAPGTAQVTVTGNITADRTFYADTVYVLNGFVKVRTGATLHIQPGTRIVGDTTVDGSSLWITRGGKIDARGTAAAPIVFTSQRAPGNRKPGDWGGLIFVGNAVDNRSAGGGVTSIFTEGPTGTGQNTAENYGGGTDANDNSGYMRYVRVEFAGFAVVLDQELNAFSFYAVGRGSDFQYLQAMSGLDDSFEFFGGSVDTKYTVSYEAGDDHYDWTEGHNGRHQFLIALQTYAPTPRTGAGFPSQDPRGFEGDGCELDKAGCSGYLMGPLSQPVWANFTLVGTGPGVFSGASVAGFKDANGVVLRRGTGGTLVNGVVARFQGIGLNVRDLATDSLRMRDSLTVANVLFNDNGGGNFDAAAACIATGSGGSCGTAANFPGASSGAANTSTLFAGLPAAGALPTVVALDWTPSAGSALATGGMAAFSTRIAGRTQGFFGAAMQGTAYIGAADPAGAKWWQGWTTYARN